MLELVDDVIKFTFNKFLPEFEASNMHYTPKEFALRYRQEVISKKKLDVDTLPFISYIRTKVAMDRFNQRLSKVGIPFKASDVFSGGGIQNIPIQQVKLNYDFMYWDKDGIKVMELTKTFFARFMRVQNILVDLGDGTIYKISAWIEPNSNVDGIYDTKGRAGFSDIGQIFFFSYKINVIAAIPDTSNLPTPLYPIQKIFVNYKFDENGNILVSDEYEVEDGQATPK